MEADFKRATDPLRRNSGVGTLTVPGVSAKLSSARFAHRLGRRNAMSDKDLRIDIAELRVPQAKADYGRADAEVKTFGSDPSNLVGLVEMAVCSGSFSARV
jgi:hypothetical protein